jgi:hypothetical protein
LAAPLLAYAVIAASFLPDLPLRRMEVEPKTIRVRGSDGLAQIVATGYGEDGRPVDVTRRAQYETDDAKVADVSSDGLLHARGDGNSRVTVKAGGQIATVQVSVVDFADARPVRFTSEIEPIFTKLGCNAGGCHGKASGQNGFKLSLLGFDSRFDYDAIVKEARGRRVFPAAPEQSLLLTKPTAQVPHGGGRKFSVGSPEYRTLLHWVNQGMPFDAGTEAKLVSVNVSPGRRTIDRKHKQQLRVSATYDDGSVWDVTRLAQYQSNAIDLATVDESGEITALDGVGEAAIMARFGGLVGVARATVPLGKEVPAWEPPPSTNPIDPFVFRKLRALGIPPSGTCTDAEFARRASLAICGVLPTPDAVEAFEKDSDPQKRARWVDRLLERPEYADFFALKWAAILRNQRTLNVIAGLNPQTLTFGFHAWIRQSLAENKPYDQFAAEIIAAKGDLAANPPATWYRQIGRTADDLVDDTAQLFLGMRIQCARCHHHPFEKWSQDDYYGFAAFFSRVGRKPGPEPGSQRVYVLPTGLARNPTSGKSYTPKALDGPQLGELGPRQDPRQELANWLRKADNPFFAKALVNRYWKHFFGRGLVEPEDDMRVSNPPTNPELLDALAADFIHSGYDLKHLVRIIATSRAFDRSSEPSTDNENDHQNFARYYPTRMSAEVLLDAINSVTGSSDAFNNLPKGTKAVDLPDEGFGSYFLDVFGRPKRESVCECERSAEANLSQTLHLLNSGEIQNKLTARDGVVSRWTDRQDARSDRDKVIELYRLCYSRLPSDDELQICISHVELRKAENKLRQGYEDLLWSLINTKEFLFNH